MHILGLLGMPRRIYTYPEGLGWGTNNLIITIGAYVLAFGFLLFIWNVVVSLRSGRLAGPNPWDGDSLEWVTPSPPPPFNFVVIPTIASRSPLWEDRLNESELRSSLDRGPVLDDGKEVLATTPLDAQPDAILKLPGDSLAPLALSVVLTALFAALMLQTWWFVVIAGVAGLGIVAFWLWPRPRLGQTAGVYHHV